MKPKTRQSLSDLVTAAKQIQDYGFGEHVSDEGFGFIISRDPEGDIDWKIEFDLPDDKERDATLLHFRRFDQQNEAFSFHKLDQLAKDEGLSQSYREKIFDIRKRYFNYLKGCPQGGTPGFFQRGSYPSHGDILRVVLNGVIVHSDKKKKAKFDAWTRDSIRTPILFQLFYRIVGHVIKLIDELAEETNKELLQNI
jgi:hypothetical protein